MARLPALTTRDQVPLEARGHFDAIAASRGRVVGPFAMMLHSPEVAGRTAHLGAYLRFESSLPPALLELLILIAAREFDCAFEWAFHFPLAREAGVTEATIEVVANGREPVGLSAEDTLVIRYGRQLLRTHRVDEDTFDAVRAWLGEAGVIEVTVTLGYYGMLATVLNATEVEIPPGAPKLPVLASQD